MVWQQRTRIKLIEIHSFDEFLKKIQELDTEIDNSSNEKLVLFQRANMMQTFYPCIFSP